MVGAGVSIVYMCEWWRWGVENTSGGRVCRRPDVDRCGVMKVCVGGMENYGRESEGGGISHSTSTTSPVVTAQRNPRTLAYPI